jgi:GNAT superfamily N-acetyltransferase
MLSPADVRIVPWDPRYAPDFDRLNRAWIEQYFTLEPPDVEILEHPYDSVIAGGGEIFFALVGDRAIGTAAAVWREPGELELAKMAVSPDSRRLGIGERLIQAVVDFARASGARVLSLDTNAKLESAVRLYERVGFRAVPLPANPEYARAGLRMEFPL